MENIFKNQFFKEIIITLAVITAYHLLGKVPLPFVNHCELNALTGSFKGNISIAALGIMPFVSAYMMVEICSLFIPFLKKHRAGDYYGRKVLDKYALILTFFLGVIQSYSIIQGLEGMSSPSGVPILVLKDKLEFLALQFTLVATVFLLLYLAEIATKHGIGNGISLLILSGISFSAFDNVSKFINHVSGIDVNFLCVSIVSIIVFISFVLIPIYLLKATCIIPLKHKSDEYPSNFLKLSSCLSGKVAIGYATSLLMLPATLLSFMGGFETLARLFYPHSFGYYLFSCIFVVLLSYLLGWLFLYPQRRFETLRNWGWNSPGTLQDSIEFIKRKFLIMNLPWSLFLCGVIILPSIAITSFNMPFYLGGSSLLIIAFLTLDIVSRFKLWNENIHEKTFKLAEFQDLHHATMIKNHLKSENIKFYLQGYYHRHLLYFFGPYIPVNLMVPVFEKERTSIIINRYYGGLGIIEKGSCLNP